MKEFRQEMVKLLAKAVQLKAEEVELALAIPPDPKLGDFAFPCFKLGKNPKEAAEKLKQNFKLPKFLLKAEVAGPYLNFFLDPKAVAEEAMNAIKKQGEGYGKGHSKKNIVVEYCGPNTNKPLHLGHLRNMALGSSICKILAFQGNKVHPVNIVNDRGVHICQSMFAYKNWGNGKAPDKKGDHFVGEYYVKFAQELQKDPELKEKVQEMLFQWEQDNPEVKALWKKMNQWVLKGFSETYRRFGVSFEKEYFESELYQQGKEVAFEGLRKKVFVKKDDKSIVAPLEKYGLADKVILRGDGTSVYMTQDLYLAQERYQDFKYDRMVYVVASEQQLHFKQLFRILELLKRPFASSLHHLSYGLVNLPTGRMKSREGTVVDADDFMDEMQLLAEKEVRIRYDLPEEKIKERADAIGLAAIKFFMLRTDASRDMVFNPEESLSFEGETGPYLQYTHARACSILRKAKATKAKPRYELLTEKTEIALAKMLAEFPQKVEETAQHYKPHILCRYLLDLAQAFNEFYHLCPVISENKDMMAVRLQLVYSVRQVLHNGLGLLGIRALEEM